MHKFDTLQIIFNLKNRNEYIDRYFNLIMNDEIKYNILIISELELKLDSKIISNFSKYIHFINSDKEIKGMNDIFKNIANNSNILKQYKYICLLEDDNYIFPEAIKECENFLNNSKNFIACNGVSFLFTREDLKYKFLNTYSSPHFSNDNLIERSKEYQKNGGIVYYSLIRSSVFTYISQKITLIDDDNLSEVFFNYLLLLKGKVETLKTIYLAREYPRPKIYNIPSILDWIKNKKLIHDLNTIINEIIIISIEKKLSYKVLLENTIFYYLKIRFSGNSKKTSFFIKIKTKLLFLLLKKNSKVYGFLQKINSNEKNKIK